MQRDRIHARLFELGAALAGGINAEIERLELPAQCRHFGSIWCVYFTDRDLASYRDIATFAATKDTGIDAEFQSYLLDRGIYLQPFWANRAFTSAAHSDADVERTIEVVAGFLASAGDRIREANVGAYA
jgi:glutamate-1-semialdehyde 2,1-aminomutase